MTKFRVSSKQRIELVKEALARFDNRDDMTRGVEIDDYVAFLEDVRAALNDKLEPRNQPKE